MSVDRDIGDGRVEVRRIDARATQYGLSPLEAPSGSPVMFLADFGEGGAVVAAQLDQPVVGADPDNALHRARFRDRDDGAECRDAVVF